MRLKEGEKYSRGQWALLAALYPISAVLWGYTGAMLWGWFVLPLFPQMPSLTWAQATGLRAVVVWFSFEVKDDEGPERTAFEAVSRTVGLTVIAPAYILAYGWVLHLFVGGPH